MAGTEQHNKAVLSPGSGSEDKEIKEKLTIMQPKIAQINQRTLTSNCHSSLNKNAMDWSRNGLLAYASHGVIVIVDCSTLTQIQTLDR